MGEVGEISKEEFELQALKELAELAGELKKAGLIDAVKELLTDYEGKMSVISNDIALFRLIALSNTILDAARRFEPSEIQAMKRNAEEMLYCTLNSVGKLNTENVEPAGLMKLLSALRDKDVQTGLGLIIALAKKLGSCIRSSA
ncbi:MAG: DUF1641 domain-containing protein [Desulfurococcales archaeon]|nr:DUF1641 domain-containing protein [Desulfurococcales archaeon]